MWVRRMSKARTLGAVDHKDMRDFRLRVWNHLKRLPTDPMDVVRMQTLAKTAMLEWTPVESLAPSLSHKPYVEKDKEVLRRLVGFSVSHHKPQASDEQMFAALGMGRSPAECFQLLIDLGVLKPDTNPCVLRFEQPLLFTSSVMAEVPKLQVQQDFDQDRSVRVDLTAQAVLTIDAATATEIDDAVGLHVDERGRTWVHVHVADPSRIIAPHSLMDAYAAERAVSVFLPETHFPLLPQALSASLLSIVPGRMTHTMTFAARLDDKGNILEKDVFPSRVQNVCKISYNSADSILANKPVPGIQISPQHEAALRGLNKYAHQREAMRQSRGAAVFQLPEPEVHVRGKNVSFYKADRSLSASRSLVEECMILGGQIAAEFARENSIPIPYRVQKKSGSNVNAYRSGRSPMPQLLQALVESELHGAAFMDVVPNKHYSMGMDAYTQVTSPIRRYTDLMVAHQIKAHLRSQTLPFSSWDILNFRSQHETTVRRVEQLQSNSSRYWLLRHMTSDEFKAKNADGLAAMVLNRAGATAVSGPGGHAHKMVKTESTTYESGDLVSVYMIDLCFRAAFKLPPGRSVQVGDVVKLKPIKIDCLRLLVDFEMA